MSNLRTLTRDYDALALDALLDSNPTRGRETLTKLTTHARGEHACPDCGSTGPHEVFTHMGQDEFACSDCGMQHCVPPI